MRILLIRLSSLGDVVMVTPVLSHLGERFPSASVTLLTREAYTPLFRADPRVAGVLGVSASDSGDVRRELEKHTWDLIIDLQNNTRSRQLRSGLPGKPAVTAFRKLHGKRSLLMLLRMSRYTNRDHVVIRYLEAAQGARWTAEDVPPMKLALSPVAVTRADTLLPEDEGRPALALMPFSAWRNKEWPLERYADIGKHFIENGWRAVVCGGPEDEDAARGFSESLGNQCVTLAGRATLDETAAVLARCSLAVGNDTGLSHLARAVGVRTGIVFGATTWHLGFFPFGPPGYRVHQTPLLCRPCHPHGGHICLRGSRPCLMRISSESVIEELTRLADE